MPEAEGTGEQIARNLARAAALLWLDERSRLLCSLSLEEDYQEELYVPEHHTEHLNMLMGILLDHAMALGDDRGKIAWQILVEAAEAHGYARALPWEAETDPSRFGASPSSTG